MNNNYKIIAVFEYSTEAHLTKSKLEAIQKTGTKIISLVLTSILIEF